MTDTNDFTDNASTFRKICAKIDAIEAEHEAELKPYKEAKKALQDWFLVKLNEMNVENIKTAEGTIHKRSRKTASIEDKSAFLGYLIENRAWDMLDLRCNSTAAHEFLGAHNEPPPGVKTSTFTDTYVLAPTKG